MSSTTLAPVNPCSISDIYNNGSYSYCVPQPVVQNWKDGDAFGRTEKYTQSEQAALDQDIQTIWTSIVEQDPLIEKRAVISAGAPGAGKTTLVRTLLSGEERPVAYSDPDDVCLKNMTQTWASDIETAIESGISERQARVDAYEKWRPASNAAHHLILGNLIRTGSAFYFGTTATSPLTAKTFEWLKSQGYTIDLVHVVASDEVRWNSIKERDKEFVQSTEEDITEKGKLLPDRLQDTYLKYADQISFYIREDVRKNAELTATWIRDPNCGSEPKGNLTIEDQEKYNKMVKIIEANSVDSAKTWKQDLEAAS